MASPGPGTSTSRRFEQYLPSPLPVMFGSLGAQNEKAVKQAFYNTAALVFVFLSGVAAVALYYILEAFLRPLIWAALCGTFLHPFKRTCTHLLRNWLRYLSDKNMPFAVGIAVLPLQTLDYSADFLGNIVKSHYKLMLALAVAFPVGYYLLIFQPYFQILLGIEKLSLTVYSILQFFQRPMLIWTTVIAYVLLLIFCWDPASKLLSYFSVPVWIMLLCHLASLAGNLQTPIFCGLVGLILVGTISQAKEKKKETQKSSSLKLEVVPKIITKAIVAIGLQPVQQLQSANDSVHESSPNTSADENTLKQEEPGISNETTEVRTEEGKSADSETPIPAEAANEQGLIDSEHEKPANQSETKSEMATDTSAVDGASDIGSKNVPRPGTPKRGKHQQLGIKSTKRRKGTSDPFFVALFWVFVITRLWFHTWVVNIIPILVCIHLLKSVIIKTGAWSFICIKFAHFYHTVSIWFVERKEAIAPAPIRGIAKLILKGDQKIIMMAESSMDKLMTVFIIVCLVVFSVMAAVFLAFQVHHESSHMVKVTSNIINETISSNPEFFKWLPKNYTTTIQHGLDSMVHRAYVHGREWIKHQVHKFLSGQYSNSSQMENQIMNFVDRVYDAFIKRNVTLDKSSRLSRDSNKTLVRTPSKSIFFPLSWRNVTSIVSSWDSFDLKTVVGFAKENIDTLRSLLESIWLILKGNFNLVISLITTVISLVFLSSTYLLNVGLSFIIFLTALFYLLSASRDQYKLVEWFSGVSMGTRFGESINNAIRDVFGAALKMATFYGLYTWVTHSVLGTNLIFIPSALAAMLAAVPFLGTYWAAIPGVLDLWLVQNEELSAILLLILHFLPTYVVDIAIYSEISGGGHPYLTGLAVAGGIFWFGLEGAIIGPIVLCCLIAAFHVYNGIFSESENSGLEDVSTPRRIYSLADHGRAGSLIFYRGMRRALSEDR